MRQLRRLRADSDAGDRVIPLPHVRSAEVFLNESVLRGRQQEHQKHSFELNLLQVALQGVPFHFLSQLRPRGELHRLAQGVVLKAELRRELLRNALSYLLQLPADRFQFAFQLGLHQLHQGPESPEHFSNQRTQLLHGEPAQRTSFELRTNEPTHRRVQQLGIRA